MNILWDLDGTIFDTYPTIIDNIYKELQEERKSLVSKEDVHKLAKVNAKFAMDMLDFTEAQRGRVYSRVDELNPSECPPFPFVKEVLGVASMNFIRTHKCAKATQTLLSHYGLKNLFEEVISGDSDFPRKPNVSSYRYLHEKYKIDLVVGDRQLDLIPAKELGILTCSFQNQLPLADYYIESYDEFGAVLLGVMFHKKSHSKATPIINEAWIKNQYQDEEDVRDEIVQFYKAVDEEDKEIAALSKIGCLEQYRLTGFYPIDSALYALEHGFSSSVVKCILRQKGSLNLLNNQPQELTKVYNKVSNFISAEDIQRIKRIEKFQK